MRWQSRGNARGRAVGGGPRSQHAAWCTPRARPLPSGVIILYVSFSNAHFAVGFPTVLHCYWSGVTTTRTGSGSQPSPRRMPQKPRLPLLNEKSSSAGSRTWDNRRRPSADLSLPPLPPPPPPPPPLPEPASPRARDATAPVPFARLLRRAASKLGTYRVTDPRTDGGGNIAKPNLSGSPPTAAVVTAKNSFDGSDAIERTAVVTGSRSPRTSAPLEMRHEVYDSFWRSVLLVRGGVENLTGRLLFTQAARAERL